MENLSPPELGEQMTLQVIEAKPHQRLACQCKVLGDVTVKCPWGKRTSIDQAWFE
jgi:ferredoxin